MNPQNRTETSSIFMLLMSTNQATLELRVNGTNSFFNGLRVESNSILTGDGSIVANVTNTDGGTLSPGFGIGRLTIFPGLMLSAGSTNIFELNHAASTNDSITGMTNVTYAGVLVVTNLAGTLTNGTTFRLFSASNYAGAFDSFIADPPAPGLKRTA